MGDVWRSIVGSAKSGIAFAVLGFLISFSNQRTITGGGIEECNFTDFGPVLFGSLGFLAGIRVLREARHSANPRLNYVLGWLSLAIGFFHLLRGFGFIGGPCNA